MATCKGCGAEIKWIKTPAGKSMPCDAEQVVYWEKPGAAGKVVTPNGDMVNYLIFSPEFGVDIGSYAKPAKTWVCVGIPCNVTHWKPLPQRPEEERYGTE